MASQKISRSAWLGKPRSTHKWWSVESKFVDKVLVGEIKMEVERRSLRIFCLRVLVSDVVATVCATGGVHTLRVASTFFWHVFLAWRTVIACTHGSRCLRCACHISPISPSPSSCFIRRPCCFCTVTSTPRARLHLPCRTVDSAGQANFRTSGELWARRVRQDTSTDGDTTLMKDPNCDDISDF